MSPLREAGYRGAGDGDFGFYAQVPAKLVRGRWVMKFYTALVVWYHLQLLLFLLRSSSSFSIYYFISSLFIKKF